MATLKNTIIDGTEYFQLPGGTTAQRPSSPTAGQSRYNSTLNTVEWYTGSNNLWYYMPNIPITNMTARYDAGEPSSYSGTGTTWADISGNSNNGTLVNSPTYSSTYGGGFQFNKSNTYVTLPTGLLTGNDFTVIMWLKGDGTGGGQTLFGNYPAGNLQMFYGTSYIGMYLANASAYADAGIWYTSNIVQYAALRSGTNLEIYLNGTLIRVGSSSAVLGGSVPFRIGTNTSGSEQFGGTIYTCQVYTSALSSSKIVENYQALRTRFGV
jgi:hypothetical protein